MKTGFPYSCIVLSLLLLYGCLVTEKEEAASIVVEGTENELPKSVQENEHLVLTDDSTTWGITGFEGSSNTTAAPEKSIAIGMYWAFGGSTRISISNTGQALWKGRYLVEQSIRDFETVRKLITEESNKKTGQTFFYTTLRDDSFVLDSSTGQYYFQAFESCMLESPTDVMVPALDGSTYGVVLTKGKQVLRKSYSNPPDTLQAMQLIRDLEKALKEQQDE